ncbi:MAG: di-heme oxidoredictase family protein [Pseudomonadota bacterium]
MELSIKKMVATCAVSFVFAAQCFAKDSPNLSRDDLSKIDKKRVALVTKLTDNFSTAEKFEARQGGSGTSFKKINRNAFSNPSQNLSFEQQQNFFLGNALFRKVWVSSPSSNHASDGLGPLFNARSCQSCHLKDGRGHPPEGDLDATSMLIRLARPATTKDEKKALADYVKLNVPDRVYGGQMQDRAIQGLDAEGRIGINYTEIPVTLKGGEVVNLRKPTYSIKELAHGPLEPGTTLSPRIAQPMIGLGLIEAIHPADIYRLADASDADNDGISGKASVVRDVTKEKLTLGKFGWKASQPNLLKQNDDAFSGDIGISSPIIGNHFGDCTEYQTACLQMATGVQPRLGDTETPDPIMGLVTFYTANLAVPARRDVSEKPVLAGKKLFYEIGCASCHNPKFVTRRDTPSDEHAFQLIWPYSDFLLHDMGEGLADNQPVGVANGQEWRTPPLWGIGLTKTVNGHTFFLHDGRARNLKEAILWHGGEGKPSRDRFKELEKQDREALIQFLGSL